MISLVLALPLLALSVKAQFDAINALPSQLQSTIPSLDAQGIQGCIVAAANADGAAVQFKDCSTVDVSFRNWTVVQGGQREGNEPNTQIKIFGNKCLDLPNGQAVNGAKLQIWTCDANNANPNQQWNLDGGLQFNWVNSNKCLDLTNGVTTNGNPIQLWDCVPRSLNQVWPGFVVPNVRTQPNSVAFGGPSTSTDSLCMSASSNADGAAVIIDKCSTSASWSLPATPLTGQVKAFSNKCLDVKDGANADGTKLQIWTCADGNTNQQWRTSSNGTLIWAGKNKCVDLTGGNSALGTPLQVWTCTGGGNQKWNYA